ncbi:hypothetical protein GCM10023210_04170 [Chryseobacterium ginsengisoli]|uniref:Uncharacterized protein n=1 Tax=Chryseobacterium ginsengisoli TaxID=363853 RepID=A0ABP9LTG6_9FLAO
MENNEYNKENENIEKLQDPDQEISDLIDELAYLNENENIRKSKKFLDDMYILDQED